MRLKDLEREGVGERERETETETDREDRQTDRDRDRETEKQRKGVERNRKLMYQDYCERLFFYIKFGQRTA